MESYMTKTPDEILSEKIMSALIEQKLIPEKIINIKQDTIRDGFEVLDVQYSQKTIT